MKFIQTGNFKEKGKELFGRTGLIDLDFMDEIELRTDIVPNSYKRILNNFDNYGFHNTGIHSNNDELVLFYDIEKIESINEVNDNKDEFNSSSDFYWNTNHDWMLLPKSKQNLFVKSINYDYQYWWMQRPIIERNYDYKLALERKKLTNN